MNPVQNGVIILNIEVLRTIFPMSINSHLLPDNETVLIAVDGRFDDTQEKAFVEAMREYPQGEKGYLLDLANASMVASAGIGLILMLSQYSSVRHKVKISNATGIVLSSIMMAHLDKFFEFQ